MKNQLQENIKSKREWERADEIVVKANLKNLDCGSMPMPFALYIA